MPLTKVKKVKKAKKISAAIKKQIQNLVLEKMLKHLVEVNQLPQKVLIQVRKLQQLQNLHLAHQQPLGQNLVTVKQKVNNFVLINCESPCF